MFLNTLRQLIPTTKLIREKITKPIPMLFQLSLGVNIVKLTTFLSAPPNINLDLFRLLAISYS